MGSENHYVFIFHFTLLWSYYVEANIGYNMIGNDKKPALYIQPYRVENIISQKQCLVKCFYDSTCYSYAIDKVTRNCHIYNVSLPHHELVTSPNTEYYTEFRDCQDWYHFGAKASGVYKVNWMGRIIKNVRCNMKIDGGGWLTFHRRFDGSVDFFEPGTWDQYKNGFGDFFGEFWLGNDYLHEMTASGDYYVLIHAESFDGKSEISKYGHFHIDSENNKYQLHFNVTLLAGRHSLYHTGGHANLDGQYFSSSDKDYDTISQGNCYNLDNNKRGPFWHNGCSAIWANGKYGTGASDSSCGLRWYQWLGSKCLKSLKMMLKRM